MPVVQLGPTAPSSGASSSVPSPRQVPPVVLRLDLAELAVLTDRAGGVRLPIELDQDDERPDGLLETRLGGDNPSVTRQARGWVQRALDEAREDPAAVATRLRELGVVDEAGTPLGEVVAALRLLSAPEAMLVLDLAVRQDGAEDRLRAWFAVAGTQVVQLSTASGLTYELAWYDVARLPSALARAATLDERAGADDPDVTRPGTPLQLPFELFTDGTEAVRRGRDDLLAELVRVAPASVRLSGAEVAPGTAAEVVGTLERATRGRLRVLVTVAPDDDEGAGRLPVGVVSWLLLGDGWVSLTPSRVAGVPTLTLDDVEPRHLGRAVAPVIAQVLG